VSIQPRPSKKDAFSTLLSRGDVLVKLDARHDAVSVPAGFKDSFELVLHYGLSLPIPIPDLDIGETGVTATLSFSREPHTTFVPWSAVYVIWSPEGPGLVFPEDVPPELIESPVERAPVKTQHTGPAGRSAGRRAATAPEGGRAGGRAARTQKGEAKGDARADASSRPALKSIPPELASAAADAAPDPSTDTRPARRKRPVLRVVK
jgi:stringent starvation protein B